MNELGNTPADKNYKPSGINPITKSEWRLMAKQYNLAYKRGYEQAKKDTIAIIKDYVEKGIRCMEQSDKFQMHTFWDGFHNCAENILRELEERNEKQTT